MDFPAGFGGGGTETCAVALVDDSKVDEVTTKRQIEVFDGPLLEGCRFEPGKAVEGDGNGGR